MAAYRGDNRGDAYAHCTNSKSGFVCVARADEEKNSKFASTFVALPDTESACCQDLKYFTASGLSTDIKISLLFGALTDLVTNVKSSYRSAHATDKAQLIKIFRVTRQ